MRIELHLYFIRRLILDSSGSSGGSSCGSSSSSIDSCVSVCGSGIGNIMHIQLFSLTVNIKEYYCPGHVMFE